MTLNDYQESAGSTAIYKGKGTVMGLCYTALGLGEAGEVQNKVKKILRDDDFILTDKRKNEIAGELGGTLWYVAMCAQEIGLSLEEVARMNLDELSARQKTNTLKGSGDERGKEAEAMRPPKNPQIPY